MIVSTCLLWKDYIVYINAELRSTVTVWGCVVSWHMEEWWMPGGTHLICAGMSFTRGKLVCQIVKFFRGGGARRGQFLSTVFWSLLSQYLSDCFFKCQMIALDEIYPKTLFWGQSDKNMIPKFIFSADHAANLSSPVSGGALLRALSQLTQIRSENDTGRDVKFT